MAKTGRMFDRAARLACVCVLFVCAGWANAARAQDCFGPEGVEADIIYNKDYRVYQFCDGDEWMSMAAGIRYMAAGNPPTDCPIVGNVCSDGSVFAGMYGGVPLYVTRCDAGMFWQEGDGCVGGRAEISWNNGNSTGRTTTGAMNDNGAINTAILMATDSDSGVDGMQPHQAAVYCATTLSGVHGHADWYLPSQAELNVLWGNRVAIGNFGTGRYWSSSEVNNSSSWNQQFSDGAQTNTDKHYSFAVRCARR